MTLHTDLEGYMGVFDNKNFVGERIDRLLKEGWEPTGEATWMSDCGLIFQVMIRRKKQGVTPVYCGYIIVSDIRMFHVNDTIRKNMEKGWIPYGAMHHQEFGSDTTLTFWQVMVKPVA